MVLAKRIEELNGLERNVDDVVKKVLSKRKSSSIM